MKQQMSRHLVNKVLDHYRDAVLQKFPTRVLTSAAIVEMENYLTLYQRHMMNRETHPAWGLALKLIFDARRGLIDVTLDEQAEVELV